MHIVHVHIVVKPQYIDAFINATLDNASNSVKEPGIARFDVIQQTDDPARFTLVEVYHSPDDVPKHKETQHYNRWFKNVEHMFAQERTRTFYKNIFPDNNGW